MKEIEPLENRYLVEEWDNVASMLTCEKLQETQRKLNEVIEELNARAKENKK